MTVLMLTGKPVNWAKPPAHTRRVMWFRKDTSGRKVTGSLYTIAALDHLNDLALAKFDKGITVIQPPYNVGVAASAGTHDKDCCLDIWIEGVSGEEIQSFARANGWGAYFRTPAEGFSYHVHMFVLPPREGQVVSDDYKVYRLVVGTYVDGGYSTVGHQVASSQIDDYYNHRTALKGHAHDPSWFPAKQRYFDLAGYIKRQQAKAKPPVASIRQKALATVMAFIAAAVVPVVTNSPGGHNPHLPPPIKSQAISVVGWNEKSFPPMPIRNYLADFPRGFALGGAKVVWLHQEISYPPEVKIFHANVRRLGYQSRGSRPQGGNGRFGDTAVTFKGFQKVRAIKVQAVAPPAGPASPARWITIAAQQDMPVVYISMHPPQGCFPKNKAKPWYVSRCKANAAEISLVRSIVAKFRKAGSAVVVAGDMNTNKQIVFGPGQQSAHNRGLMQLVAFSSDKVKVVLSGGHLIRGFHTDHPLIMATVRMTVIKKG